MGLLNVDGYYNALLSFLDKAVAEGFITPAARSIIVSAQTAQELMCKLEVHFLFWSTNYLVTRGEDLFAGPTEISQIEMELTAGVLFFFFFFPSLNEGLQAQALRN